jgi:aspartate racemase
MRSPARHLLVCTDGARRARLFENHPLWPRTRDRFVVPADDDQRRVHALLYAIKTGRCDGDQVAILETLLQQYGVVSWIAGCTEAHLLAKVQARLSGRPRRDVCLDPLTTIVPMIAGRIPASTFDLPAA